MYDLNINPILLVIFIIVPLKEFPYFNKNLIKMLKLVQWFFNV